ncbi:hypothetical protein [Amycolatopsis sp. NPDC051128]|uniref:hypothetical protein n=1 Tax=Amycolatopsis sp. NPDC051128 TaxID=3155412 RepID=UPI00344592C7
MSTPADPPQGRNRDNADMARPGGTHDAVQRGQEAVNDAWVAHRRAERSRR